MPPPFPRARPSIRVTCASYPGFEVRHAMLDAGGMLTGSPSLNAWTSATAVGRTLTAVMEDFSRSPPVLVAAQPAAAPGPYGAPGPAPYGHGAASTGASQPIYSGRPGPAGQLPSYPGAAASSGAGHPPALPGYGTAVAGAGAGSDSGAAPAAAAAGSGSGARARAPVPRQRIPDIPSAFPELESMTYYPLELLKTDADARRQFLKDNVDALRMKREGLQMQFKANMEAATGLVSLASAQSSSTETAGEQLALLLVQKQEAERLFVEAKTRVQSVLRRLNAGELAARLPDKQSEVASLASAMRDTFLRGSDAPPPSAGGERETPERMDWLDSALDRYVEAQTRFHRLAAVEAVARVKGVAPPAPPARLAAV